MSRIHREQPEERIRILGNIKVGEKVTIKKDGKDIEIPKSLDYFIATGDYKNEFEKAFPENGGKPNKIEITFLSDNDDTSCSERYELRTGKKLFAHGDGKIFNVWDKDKEEYSILKIEEDQEIENLMGVICSEANKIDPKASWDEILYLRFLILRINHILGVWEFSTKGKKSSIKEIVSTFDLVKNMTCGRVRGVPFDLSVKKVTSQKVGAKHSFPVVSLTANKSYENLERMANLIEQGVELRGLLTDEKIDEVQEQAMIEYTPNVKSNVQKFEEMIEGIADENKLKEIALRATKEIPWIDKDEYEISRLIYEERLKELEVK